MAAPEAAAKAAYCKKQKIKQPVAARRRQRAKPAYTKK
jgi:hypothetical protein